MPWHRIEECNRGNIRLLGGRMHAKVGTPPRYVTVILHNEQLYCIDSCCFHASGPMGEGPVRDIEDIPTIRCMWHNIIVSLDTGERVTQECLLPGELNGGSHQPMSMSFPLRPQGGSGRAKRHGEKVQRVHQVKEVEYAGVDPERFPIEVSIDERYDEEVRSDIVACSPQYARMCIEMQRRRIDTNQVKPKDGAGDRDEQKEVQNLFVRTLLHSMQTAAVPAVAGAAGSGPSSPASSTSSSSSNSSPLSPSGGGTPLRSNSASTGGEPSGASTESSSSPLSKGNGALDAVDVEFAQRFNGGGTGAAAAAAAAAMSMEGGDMGSPMGDPASPKGPPGNPRAPTPPPGE